MEAAGRGDHTTPKLPRKLLAIHVTILRHEQLPTRCTTDPTFSTCNTDNRFRVIFDAVNDGIFIVNPGTGKFIEANQNGCDLFGYNKSELIGRDIATLSSGDPPYTQDMAIEWLRKASLGRPQVFEWQCRKKDEVRFWAEISIRFTKFEHSPAVIAIVRDITAAKAAGRPKNHAAQHYVILIANCLSSPKALDRAIAQSVRSGKVFHFYIFYSTILRNANDTRGHRAGRSVVAARQERLLADVRLSETVARFGGEPNSPY